MTLAERIAQLKELEAKATPAGVYGLWLPNTRADLNFADAMRNAIWPLIQVVEQQREALAELMERAALAMQDANRDGGEFDEDDELKAARAALALMDKEDGNG